MRLIMELFHNFVKIRKNVRRRTKSSNVNLLAVKIGIELAKSCVCREMLKIWQ